ncbi:carbon-nitrogen hydrolase [Fuerstiella marisgermanici]|uniref:(R)-stereoselective amidase n=1 Tax=Fuerstiella marisgermanici TaxID=1891926 RepID=A0A1P8WL44_9PLAN|nr:carbon-nitrogen hydrolase [Fuerstiella marisgermanici]APZ94779.1 (R)-stereoselective amidase [Fuerstiella marisgermanici]
MPSPNPVNVSLIQMTCSDDANTNLDRTIQQIREVAAEGAQVICLQEVFNTQYPCQSEDHANFALAETIPGPTTDAICKISKELQVVVVVPLFEKRTHGLYHNSAVVVDADGSVAGLYRKMHIPDDPLYYEKFYFTPGDLGFHAFPTKYAKVGVCICWDQWYPEAARLTAMKGAELLFYPTAIGWIPGEKEEFGESQYSAWQTMIRSHAIANGLFVGAPNRVGVEGEIQFWGGSFLADPYGKVLQQASHDVEQNLVLECDLGLIDTARTHWPFFRDRRIDAFGDLQKRWCED